MVASLEHASHQRAPGVFFDDVEKVLDELILEHLGGTSLLDDPVGLSTSEVQADSCDRQSVVVRKALGSVVCRHPNEGAAGQRAFDGTRP